MTAGMIVRRRLAQEETFFHREFKNVVELVVADADIWSRKTGARPELREQRYRGDQAVAVYVTTMISFLSTGGTR